MSVTDDKQYKKYAPDSYYHIYSRGVNKEPIFKSEKDYDVFCSLFKRYLSSEREKNSVRCYYPNYSDQIELLAYALMPNHFHILIYQGEEERSIEQFMRSLVTSYSKYFNKEHGRVGPVFQSRYLAKLIISDSHLLHISRYIHLNPEEWRNSLETSIDYYLDRRKADWIKPDKITGLFSNLKEYEEFLEEYDPDSDENYLEFKDIEPYD